MQPRYHTKIPSIKGKFYKDIRDIFLERRKKCYVPCFSTHLMPTRYVIEQNLANLATVLVLKIHNTLHDAISFPLDCIFIAKCYRVQSLLGKGSFTTEKRAQK